jgi:hypothetical protein
MDSDGDAVIVGSSLGTVHLPQPEDDAQGFVNAGSGNDGINATLLYYGATQP